MLLSDTQKRYIVSMSSTGHKGVSICFADYFPAAVAAVMVRTIAATRVAGEVVVVTAACFSAAPAVSGGAAVVVVAGSGPAICD